MSLWRERITVQFHHRDAETQRNFEFRISNFDCLKTINVQLSLNSNSKVEIQTSKFKMASSASPRLCGELFSFKVCGPLLQERAGAFFLIFGRAGQAEQHGFKVQTFAQR